MKLSKLIRNINVEKTIGNLEIEIESLALDSERVLPAGLFFCINGLNVDGHNFVKEAERYGAVAVVTEKELQTNLTQIIVKNSRLAMSYISAEFYGHADRKMKLVGIVGTNGKTSTAHLIKNIIEYSGEQCGVIGTLGTFYNEKYLEPTLTTPDPITLHKTLAQMYKSGIKIVVMEVSAHAISLYKVEGIRFEVGVFTNFSQDHLDFFENMQAYENAKLKFFDSRCKFIVTNSDDATGIKILNAKSGVLSYGLTNPADVFAIDINESKLGTQFVLNLFDCIYRIKTCLLGRFNVYNLLAASSTCALLGLETETIAKALNEEIVIRGRLEKVYDKNFSVYVDYAHTPDGLKNSLLTLKNTCKNRLICVFGCGGNRDAFKREKMGEISGKYADFTIVTSDNPRFEEPMEIIYQIERGLLKASNNYVLIEDRKDAISYALKHAGIGDVVLVAGKGGENYQDVLGIKHPYNDNDKIREFLRGNSN